MTFVYAKELKETYEVWGSFYTLQVENSTFNCRNSLEIRRKNTTTPLPDMVIVMMNPGSSKYMNGAYTPKVYTKETINQLPNNPLMPTRPDPAQYQIMRLMELLNWNMVRIINLSDIIEGKSSEFIKLWKCANKNNNDHIDSIMSKARAKERKAALTNRSGNIIGAWGSKPELEKRAEQMLIDYPNLLGVRLENCLHYQYASVSYKHKKIEWLEAMQQQCNLRLQHYATLHSQ